MSNAKRVAYNTFVQAGGRLFINALGIISVGLTTRYLGLDTYGQLTTALLFVALFSSLSEAGITITSVRELSEGKRDWADIVGNIATLRFMVGLVFAVVTIAAGHLIYGDPSHHYVTMAIDYLTVTTVLTAIQTSMTTVLSARLRNDLVVIGAVLNRLISLGGLIAVVHYDLGYGGLLLATLAGAAVNFISDTAFSLGYVRPKPRFHLSYWRYILILAAPIGIASIINMLYLKIDGIILSVLKSSQEVAFYGVAYKLMDLLTALPSFFTASIFPLMAASKDDKPALARLTDRAVRFLDMLAAPLVIGTIVVSNHLAIILGGSSFKDAALPMAILALGNLFVYANAGYSTALFAIGGQKQMLKIISVVFAANIAINIAAIPLFGAVGAAAAVTISEIVSLSLLLRIYRKEIGPATGIKRVLPYLGISLIMGAVTYAAELLWFSEPTFVNLLALTAIGGGTYVALLRIFKLLYLSEIKSIIKPI